MSLRRIHIADHKGRESSVSFTSLRHQQDIDYFYEESLVSHTRLLSDSKVTNIDHLTKTYQDNLADEIINAFNKSPNSVAIAKKNELERQADSSR